MKTFLALTTGFLSGVVVTVALTRMTMAEYGIRFETDKDEEASEEV